MEYMRKLNAGVALRDPKTSEKVRLSGRLIVNVREDARVGEIIEIDGTRGILVKEISREEAYCWAKSILGVDYKKSKYIDLNPKFFEVKMD